ncbi:MAG: hypothetical protein UW46_C0001G0052 [Candidatus Yanofskybacteria bacterium GW2011_GWF1_44_227]|uniref:Peptidase S8/S53 domain-containing protein n=1 Tax=Candidatus Yanofskybacteria bacterium GW2011_GWE2_40_11 TaxID=1619033 RepID=A0A0G0QK73_9BACT|nr:MAG: hypothetical protein UT69_C0022G0010 [Candidatus Yanofskybacteria bacterium GW2011_GWE1_40_10]KKR40809.1 MAG: hypothetical protein UT75_C0004G0020 [Candidatus Yanofskybacteria bacterium GW2011_GWE2_40_11]KKT15924.1 MAG: hypothetical protein UV97_C0001G0097 [Candidatus Yanofskybacteria bacterium GW2011_GWF2_43_596]KKT53562.1 MAG: hypothetical protein UW46_C0001G0052 [Candidatus Yanofskybacteria bacterium GW2011_GWF1_44_227]OGN36087.1 MAG: hypothetical protein A2207_03450 [Candidatus Yano
MNIKRIVPVLAIIAVFGVAFGANAAANNTRYLVKSNASFWKKSFNVRQIFDVGFTADLTDWQLRLTKIFGVEITSVNRLNILETKVAPKLKAAYQAPVDSIPWGVKTLYSDPTITKSSGGDGVKVAVLDTGVAKHPDIKIKECRDFTGSKPMIEDKCDDNNGHGTHMAGIILANGGSEGNGIWGMAPEAELYAYKVCLDNGSCWADDVAAGIITAVDQKVNVIVLGLGSDIESNLIRDAIAYGIGKNVLFVAAAGNDGPYAGSIDYPATDKSVVSVGAIDFSDKVPDWSARGEDEDKETNVNEDGYVNFVAPGVGIESLSRDGGYVVSSGTSMAAAHVAGLATKLWQKDDKNPAVSTFELLKEFSQKISSADDGSTGWGLPRL